MTRYTRVFLIAVLTVAVAMIAAGARADVEEANGSNIQDGRNTGTTNQAGKGSSGEAVGGQVSGVVSSGAAAVDARNSSRDSSVSTGNVDGSNSASSIVGLNTNEGEGPTVVTDITNACTGECENIQDGNNRYTVDQTLAAVSGDGVGGQVIGVIALRAADPSIVASNRSDGVDVETGDADGSNASAAFVGLNASDSGPFIASDIVDSCTTECDNVQDGDNTIRSRQWVGTHSGDGVAGQVIGAVTNWHTSIDATNHTSDSTVDTGDSTAENGAAYFAGLNESETGPTLTASDITDSCLAECANVQEGDNRVRASQTSASSSGDGVTGSVIGVVSARGTVSVVAANSTVDSDVDTGDAESTNDLAAFVGLNSSEFGGPVVAADITASCIDGCPNVQEGDNGFSGSQSARAATGDGVAGQVLGVVAAGNVSIDARNRSVGDSVETGDADAHNNAALFVGLNAGDVGPTLTASDITNVTATNVQDGDNRKTLRQNADATSGDAVAGQVSGVVTSAGGSVRLVLANTSEDIDASSGDGDFSNDETSFVGLNTSSSTVIG